MQVLTAAASAPRSNKSSPASTCPRAHAIPNGDQPPSEHLSTAAPASSSKRAASTPFQTRDEQWRIAVIILLVDASALPKKRAYRGDFTLDSTQASVASWWS